ncbi:hypothetical protein [Paenibacillus alba]|uniref:hypothetical protein n=1 Tax=Paenibacillus alba TaxID=1197127 RepID=UPI0015634892|nr:hypothetical protein [Paenibacillus alba]
MTISNDEARKRAERNWGMWRLLLSDMNITYTDLDRMDLDDIAEANAALDIHIEMVKKSTEEKKRS